MYEYRILGARVVDGDTVDLDIDLGCKVSLRDRFRLYGPDPNGPDGLNAPEMNTPEGKAAKAFLAKIVENAVAAGFPLVARTLKDRKEKYGRWLVVIYEPDGTLNVNAELLKAGHAVLRRY